MAYIPKYFKIEELTPPDICNSSINQWFLFDERILMTADNLRRLYGPLYCNTWCWNRDRMYSGFRSWATQVGSKNSQHKLGRALDLIPAEFGLEVDDIRDEIIANPFKEEFKFITAIESNVPWLHIDCRNYDKAKNGLLIFSKQ